MDKRLELSLEKAIFTLQEWSGHLEEYRLQRRITNNGGDHFYEIKFLIRRLVQLELVEENNSQSVTLTQKGWEFKGFDHIRFEGFLKRDAENLAQENLKLQNENLAIQNSSQGRQAEIDKLIIENLKLQNQQIKRYIIYSIVAFIAGAILTNYKEIWHLIKSFLKS